MADNNAEIGQNRDHPAQAKACAFGRRQLHSAADQIICHAVDLANLQRVHAVISADRHAVGGAQLQQKFVGIHLHRGVCAR